MDKISFSTVEAQCGALSEFIDLLVNRQEGYNISIKPVNDGFDVEFTKEGKLEFLKPEEIIVHPVELPNGDIVWSQDAAEDEKILARWNKIME